MGLSVAYYLVILCLKTARESLHLGGQNSTKHPDITRRIRPILLHIVGAVSGQKSPKYVLGRQQSLIQVVYQRFEQWQLSKMKVMGVLGSIE